MCLQSETLTKPGVVVGFLFLSVCVGAALVVMRSDAGSRKVP